MTELLQRVQQVFHDVFADDSIRLARGTTAEDIEGWDSMGHINLLIALERTFRVRFTTAEMAGLARAGQTVSDLLDLLESKLGGGGAAERAG